jgi:hypothetical protein
LENWYVMLLTTAVWPFVGDTGTAIFYPLLHTYHDFDSAFNAVKVLQ